MAFTTAYLTPRVEIVDGDLLTTATRERILKVALKRGRLFPRLLGIAKEHAKKVACARLVGLAIGGTSMHDAQVVDELDVPLLAIKLGADLLGRLFDCLDGVHLLFGQLGHTRIARDVGATEERRLYKLAHGFSL